MPFSLPQDAPDPTVSREDAINFFRGLVASLPVHLRGNAALLETFQRLGSGLPFRSPFTYEVDRYAADWQSREMKRDPAGPLCQHRQAQAVAARLTRERDDAERVAAAYVLGWTIRRGAFFQDDQAPEQPAPRRFVDASDPTFPASGRWSWVWWRPRCSMEERPAFVFLPDSTRIGAQDLPPLDDTLRLELDVQRARAWAERALFGPEASRR